jgi:hypothetical protein
VTVPVEPVPSEPVLAEPVLAEPALVELNGGTLRQPIVKAPGRSRRAKLLPAPDTDPNPHPPVLREEGGVASATPGSRSANEGQLRQDRPPHW